MFAADSLGSVGGASDGAIAGWRFIAPPGTAIVGLQDDRYLGAYADNGWLPFLKADGTVLETCMFTIAEEGCFVGEPFGSGSLNGILQVSEVETLTIGIKCVAVGGCTTGSTLHRAWAALYGAKVTLSTQAPPAIASPTGSLWGAGPAGGFHKGVEQVSFAATDLTGVASATVSVDGRVVASQQGVCDYTQPLPCKPLSLAFQVDTAALSDGSHTAALDAYDAAGNDGRLTELIVVANQPPAPPVGLKALGQSGGSYLVSWSDPPDVAPIVGFTYELCPPGGIGCTTPTATGHDSPLSLPASAAGQTIKLWLVDAAGNSSPANAASLTLGGSAASRVQAAGARRLPSLRLSDKLRGRRLTVVALAPAGLRGRVQFSVQVLRGRTHVAHASRRVKVKRGRAEVVFVLTRRALGASRLTIKASAQGASTATVSIVLRRSSRRRARG